MLDPLPILDALGVTEPGAVVPVSGGCDTSLWRFELGAHNYALRVFRPEQVGVWHREAMVLSALYDDGLPVPQLLGAAVAHNPPALLLAWCDGRTLLDELQIRPWQVWRLATEMGRVQARIYAMPLTDVLGCKLPRGLPDTRTQTQRYERCCYRLARPHRRSCTVTEHHRWTRQKRPLRGKCRFSRAA